MIKAGRDRPRSGLRRARQNGTRPEKGPLSGDVSVEKEAGSKVLATFVLKAGGPNT